MKIHLEGITIHYKQMGAGRPIIFLHGQSLDHRFMLHEFEPLFERRQNWLRLYVDLPGHGGTQGPEWITHQDQVLDVLLEFIDRIIPQQHFALMSHSYGSYLARGIAYRRPAQVDGLAMLVPMILADRTKRDLPAHVTLVENQDLVSGLSPEMQGLFENVVVVQSEMALHQIQNLIQPAQELGNEEFQERLEAHRAFSFDVDNPEKPFAKPVLMIMGRQDSVVGYRDQWRIFENFPRAAFAVLDKAGHGLGITEQRDLNSMLINEWLDRVEAETN